MRGEGGGRGRKRGKEFEEGKERQEVDEDMIESIHISLEPKTKLSAKTYTIES